MSRSHLSPGRLVVLGALVLGALLMLRFYFVSPRGPATGRSFAAEEIDQSPSVPDVDGKAARGVSAPRVGDTTAEAPKSFLVVRTISRRSQAPIGKARISVRDADGKVIEDLVSKDDGYASLRFEDATISTTKLVFEAEGHAPRQLDLGDVLALREREIGVAVVGLVGEQPISLAVRCVNGCSVERAMIVATSRPPIGFAGEPMPRATPLVRSAESGLWGALVRGDPWVDIAGLLDSHPDVRFALDVDKEAEGRVVEFACGPVVHGRLAWPDGRPAAGVLVVLYGADRSGDGNRNGVATRENGGFYFGAAFRPETIVVEREPKVVVRLDHAAAKKRDIDLGTITLAADDAATLKVEGVGGSQVALALSVSPQGSEEPAARQTSYDGVFRVPRSDAAVLVRLMDERFGSLLKEWSLDSIAADQVLDGRGSLGSVSFTLPAASGLGETPGTPRVLLSRSPEDWFSARVHAGDGPASTSAGRRFEIGGLPVGAYSLRIGDVTGSVSRENVAVRGDQCTELGLLGPRNDVTISGRILSKASIDVPGFVTADLKDAAGALQRIGSAYCSGTFRFAVAAASVVVLSASSEDGAYGQVEVEVRTDSIDDVVLRVGRPAGLVVNVLAGGKLVVGRPVTCWTSASTSVTRLTETSGAATFRDLPPGRAMVFTSGAKRTLTLTPETVETIVIDVGDESVSFVDIEGLPKGALLVAASFVSEAQSVCDFALSGVNCEITAPLRVRLPSASARRGLLTLQIRDFTGTFAALIDADDARKTCDVSAALEIRTLGDDAVAPVVSILSIDGVAIRPRSTLGMRTPCIASGPRTYTFALPTGAVEVLVRAAGKSEKKSFQVGVGERLKLAL